MQRFSNNVEIAKGDFFNTHKLLADNSVDLINIDIAMDGDYYKFFFANYLSKLTKTGIALLEGGSKSRDQVHWMKRYNRKSIRSTLSKKRKDFDFFVIEPFPSLTIIRRNSE